MKVGELTVATAVSRLDSTRCPLCETAVATCVHSSVRLFDLEPDEQERFFNWAFGRTEQLFIAWGERLKESEG